MISHRNVIANVLQVSAFEQPYRDAMKDPKTKSSYVDVALGLLPQSHIYSLVVACHATGYRGDQTINLAKFELNTFLNAIQRFKISALFLVSLHKSRVPAAGYLLWMYQASVVGPPLSGEC